MKPTVEITIGPDGSVKVGAKNVAGPGCKQLTAEIEKALGTTTADVKTADFHRTATQGQSAKQTG